MSKLIPRHTGPRGANERPPTPAPPSGQPPRVHDMATVLFFLKGAAEDRLMYNSHTGKAAFDAACRLLNVDQRKFLQQTAKEEKY